MCYFCLFVLIRRSEGSLFRGTEPEYFVERPSDELCLCNSSVCQSTGMAELCHIITGKEITNQLDIYIQERSLQSRSKRQVEDDWSVIDYDPGLPDEQVSTYCLNIARCRLSSKKRLGCFVK